MGESISKGCSKKRIYNLIKMFKFERSVLEFKVLDKGENILAEITQRGANKEVDWDWGFSMFALP